MRVRIDTNKNFTNTAENLQEGLLQLKRSSAGNYGKYVKVPLNSFNGGMMNEEICFYWCGKFYFYQKSG